MTTSRMEGFSDGVVAVAITLLPLLMSICAIPFATDLMAHDLRHGAGVDLATA